MTADVYASDDHFVSDPAEPSLLESITFCVTADAQANVFLLIAVQLNLMNKVPSRVIFEKRDDDTVQADITIRGCSERAVNLVCRKLEQLTCVRSVFVPSVGPSGN
jgi:hypothetical protein